MSINIEVVFATIAKQIIIPVTVEENITILKAIELSKIADHFPEYQLNQLTTASAIGIFGKKIDVKNYQLRDRDRIEIYRPLNKTPNQKRLERIK